MPAAVDALQMPWMTLLHVVWDALKLCKSQFTQVTAGWTSGRHAWKEMSGMFKKQLTPFPTSFISNCKVALCSIMPVAMVTRTLSSCCCTQVQPMMLNPPVIVQLRTRNVALCSSNANLWMKKSVNWLKTECKSSKRIIHCIIVVILFLDSFCIPAMLPQPLPKTTAPPPAVDGISNTGCEKMDPVEKDAVRCDHKKKTGTKVSAMTKDALGTVAWLASSASTQRGSSQAHVNISGEENAIEMQENKIKPSTWHSKWPRRHLSSLRKIKKHCSS